MDSLERRDARNQDCGPHEVLATSGSWSEAERKLHDAILDLQDECFDDGKAEAVLALRQAILLFEEHLGPRYNFKLVCRESGG
jgi:hypothetical protein